MLAAQAGWAILPARPCIQLGRPRPGLRPPLLARLRWSARPRPTAPATGRRAAAAAPGRPAHLLTAAVASPSSSNPPGGPPRSSSRIERLWAWASASPRPQLASLALLLGALVAIAWGRNLAAAGLIDDTEPLFAEAARQMAASGDWLTPRFNLLARFDKPALIYWLMAAAIRLLGEEVWVVRLPSAAAAAGLAAAVTATAWRFGLAPPVGAASAAVASGAAPAASPAGPSAPDSWARWLEAAVAGSASSLTLFAAVWGSAGLSDMLLAATVGGALLSFFWGYAANDPHASQAGAAGGGLPLSGALRGPGSGPGAKFYYMAAVLAGASLLAKGPVGPLLIVLAAGGFMLAAGDLLPLMTRELPLLRGGAIAAAVAGPWYAAITALHGVRYVKTFFGYHNVERFTKGVNHHGSRPLWYAPASILAGFFPWSLTLPPALWSVLRPQALAAARAGPRAGRLPLLAAAWLLSCMGFFACSASQLPSYYLPLLPAVALLASHYFAHVAPRAAPGLAAAALPAALAVAFGAGAGALRGLPASLAASPDLFTARIGSALGAAGVGSAGGLSLGPAAALSAAAAVALALPRGWLSPGARAAAVRGPLVACISGMALLLATVFTPALRAADSARQLPIRSLAASAVAQQQQQQQQPRGPSPQQLGENRPQLAESGAEILAFAGPTMPSVVWYARQPVAYFHTAAEALSGARAEAAPGVRGVLLIAEDGTLEAARRADKDGRIGPRLAGEGGYTLVRVRAGRGDSGA